MPSKVSLMNRALRLVNGKPLTSPDEAGAHAMLVSMAWDDVLATVLGDHAWQHFIRWEALPRLDKAPAFGPAYAYRLPPDCLRLVDVRSSGDLSAPGADYYLAGQDVYTDASPCYARYVAMDTATQMWPPHFCEAFCLRLAAEIAPGIGTDSGLPIKLRQMYLQSLEMARLTDTAQSQPKPLDAAAACGLLQARK